MSRLNGKVAIITGGAGGQGEAHARLFVKEGAKVVITDLNVDAGEALAKELGENAKFIKHDVSKAEDWENVVNEGEATFGPINVLINNAGFTISNRVEDVSEEEYRKVIGANQVGVFLGMKAVLPSMKKAGNGSIVNISSINGFGGSPETVSYDSAKFAVRGMTKSAALDFADYGIRVNSVHPGPIDTAFTKGEGITEEMIRAYADAIPMKRFGRAEEVSQLCLFLASDESSFSTGSEFTLDGGMTARP